MRIDHTGDIMMNDSRDEDSMMVRIVMVMMVMAVGSQCLSGYPPQ